MGLAINHNLMAANTASNLNSHYDKLSVSTQRLSSGLRINSAADDAAGLAIRELQRTEIAALQQGSRNASDAISLIQTADGALGVIDEKLTRMKELAEQAATGTYDSTQRLMIESEYQAMASEITRIANATDFNGIHLLNGNLSSNVHDGSGLTAKGKLKVHFGTGNDSAEDYYYIQIGNCTASALKLGMGADPNNMSYEHFIDALKDGKTSCYNAIYNYRISQGDSISAAKSYAESQSQWQYEDTLNYYYNGYSGEYGYDDAILAGYSEDDAVNAGVAAVTSKLYDYLNADYQTNAFGNGFLNSSHRYAGMTISTQELAQTALSAITEAIVKKDKIRANLGAIQNRLENTITNLNVQAENLQASESRISDVDVASEMTEFVRQQILAQSAVAMLSQANSMPKMAMQLISG